MNKIIALLLLISFSFAAPAIMLKTGAVNPSLKSVSAQSVGGPKEGLYLVQFDGPILSETKKALDSKTEVLSYVPQFAYLVKFSKNEMGEVKKIPHLERVLKYKPDYKVMPELKNKKFDAVIQTVDGVVRKEVNSQELNELVSSEEVIWVEEYQQPKLFDFEKVLPFNNATAPITHVDYVQENFSLLGTGQLIGVADTGLDTGVKETVHLDFRGRVSSIINILKEFWPGLFGTTDSSDTHGHGTHVSGSILGNGTRSNGEVIGAAPNATLYFQDIGEENVDYGGEINHGALYTPSDLNLLFQPAYDAGVRIHSNSWGSGSDGSYSTGSKTTDEFVWDNPDMLIVFAAGNEGCDLACFNTIGSPATAKNVLTVGASKYNLGVANFSSRGLTDDGRIKPDIVAPGYNILSTKSSVLLDSCGAFNSFYCYMSGTSMATPHVAGSAALLREYYQENKSITPSAALLKATLLGSADSFYSPTPNKYEGWGLMNLKNAILPDEPKRNLYWDEDANLNTTNSTEHSFYVINSTEDLKVVLVWTDHYLNASTSIILVNDLDLNVTNSTNYWTGNYSDRDEANRRDNVEGLFLENPQIGEYTANITAYNIPQGTQDYALFVTGGVSEEPIEISLSYPENNYLTGVLENNFSFVASTAFEIKNCSVWTNETTWSEKTVNITTMQPGTNNITHTLSSSGAFTWGVKCFDVQGNSKFSENRTIIIDSTAPQVSDLTPTNESTTNSYLVSANYSDNTEINTNSVRVFFDNYNVTDECTITPTYFIYSNATIGQGDHNITLYVNDTTGNQNTTYWGFTFDSIAPEITIVLPTENNYTNSTIPLNLTFSETVSSVQYRYNSNPNVVFTENTTFEAQEGPAILSVFATDIAGNLNSNSVNFNVDTIAPSISLNPANETITNNATLNLTFSDATSGVNITSVSVNDSNFNNTNNCSGNECIWAANLAQGQNFLEINVSDYFGNNATYYYNITYDSIAPNIYVVLPANTTYDNVTRELNLTFSEETSMVYYNYNGTNYTFTTNTTFEATEGNNTLRVYANDTAGNWNSTSIHFSVDLSAPEISNVDVFPPLLKTGDNVTVTATFTDATNVTSTWFNVSNSTYEQNITMESGTGNWTALAVGEYNITIYSKDFFNHTSNSSGGTIIISTPIIAKITTKNATSNINTNIRFKYNTRTENAATATDSDNLQANIASGNWDVEVDSTKVNMTLDSVNLTSSMNLTLTIEDAPENVTISTTKVRNQLETFGLSFDGQFNSATLLIPFNGTARTNERTLRVQKCNEFNLTSQECTGIWTDITSNTSTNYTTNVTTINVSSFSGFSIIEPTYCGDGILQSTNGEGVSEQCDGSALNGQTCVTKGFDKGTLSCSSCAFVTSSCSNNHGGGGGSSGGGSVPPVEPVVLESPNTPQKILEKITENSDVAKGLELIGLTKEDDLTSLTEFSSEVAKNTSIDYTVDRNSDGTSYLDLTLSYSGEKIEKEVIVVTVPKTFAESSDMITVETSFDYVVVNEDPAYAITLNNVEPREVNIKFVSTKYVNRDEVRNDFEAELPTILATRSVEEEVIQEPEVIEEPKVNETVEPKINITKPVVNESHEPEVETAEVDISGLGWIVLIIALVIFGVKKRRTVMTKVRHYKSKLKEVGVKQRL